MNNSRSWFAKAAVSVVVASLMLGFALSECNLNWSIIQTNVSALSFQSNASAQSQVEDIPQVDEEEESNAFVEQWLPIEPHEKLDLASIYEIRAKIEEGQTLTGQEWVDYNVAKAVRIKARHESESPTFARRPATRQKNES